MELVILCEDCITAVVQVHDLLPLPPIQNVTYTVVVKGQKLVQQLLHSTTYREHLQLLALPPHKDIIIQCMSLHSLVLRPLRDPHINFNVTSNLPSHLPLSLPPSFRSPRSRGDLPSCEMYHQRPTTQWPSCQASTVTTTDTTHPVN